MKASVFAAFFCLLLAGCRSTSKLEVVSGFNQDRYLGTWYEAVRYDHGFERDMSNVSATYSLNDDGTIRVLNRGYKENTEVWDEIEGVAKPKKDKDIGWLKVSFFKPFYASYKVIYLDSGYTEAIVASSTYSYLWILVRDPALPNEKLIALVDRAEELGFDRGKMIFVDQGKNIK